MRFCLECGTPLADAPIIVNLQDSGTQKQTNIDTASFNQTQETRIASKWNFQQNQQNFGTLHGFTAPPPQRPQSNKKIFFALAGFFAIFLLFIGAGAAIIGYNIMIAENPKPTPTPLFSPTPETSPSRTRTPKPSQKTSPELENTPTVTENSASVKFDRTWIDYNVTENGRHGMRIHNKFWVNNLKGVDLYLGIYFQTKDGVKLLTDNRNFRSKDGQVAIFRALRPAYDETVYEDVTLFMPYEELNLGSGFYELQMDIDLIYENGEMIQHLNLYDFEYEKD
jgi:hypothetical protein